MYTHIHVYIYIYIYTHGPFFVFMFYFLCVYSINTSIWRRPTETPRPATATTGRIYILQRGVQWKQGVVNYMRLHASLLYDTTPIHCTRLPLHPPLQSIQRRSPPPRRRRRGATPSARTSPRTWA